MKNKKHIYIIVALLSIGVLLTYFYQFHAELSNTQSDWSDFATFFTSLLSPVLVLINIVIFIYLTKSIERNRQLFENEKDKELEKRHQDEIEHQKSMQLFKSKVEIIQNLDTTLEKTFVTNVNNCTIGIPVSMVETISILETFRRNELDIFDYSLKEEKELFVQLIKDGYNNLVILMEVMRDPKYLLEQKRLVTFPDFKSVLIRNPYALILNRPISLIKDNYVKLDSIMN